MIQMADIEELRIMIFDIGGIRLGIDTDAISEICRADQTDRRTSELFRFDDRFSFREKVVYKSPMVIYIKDEKRKSAILIEHPEDVGVPISIDEICPIPPLIRFCYADSPFWAAAVKDENIILLVDPYRLI
jgi:hypothetical protein